MTTFVRSLLLFATICLISVASHAQAPASTEIGIQTSYLQVPQFGKYGHAPGFGGRYTRNLSTVFAVDTQFDYYPVRFSRFQERSFQQGGRAFTFAAGLKTGIRHRHWGAFAKLRPGLMTFTDAASNTTDAPQVRTNFMLDTGAVVEIQSSPRTILRVDVSNEIVRFGGHETCFGQGVAPFRGALCVDATPSTEQMLQLSFGVSRRLGAPVSQAEKAEHPRRFEIGAQFVHLSGVRGENGGGATGAPFDEPGFGGRAGWNVFRWLALESELNFFPRSTLFVSPQEGGRIFQTVAGPKLGIRSRHIGLFAKVRPGIVRFDRTLVDARLDHFRLGTAIHFALDAGGLFECYPSRSTLLRFDAGVTKIFLPRASAISFTGATFALPAEHRDTIQLSTGFGWRF